MARSKWYLLFFISYSTNLFSGLLPDNIVYMGHNRCCSVKDLELGDLIVSTCSSGNTLNNISGIKLNKNIASNAILLTLESREKRLSSLMIGADQRFCAQIEPDDENSLMWIEAENLDENMLLLGYNNEKFKIRKVQNIPLKSSADLYDLSLNPNNTFYLVDSEGNLILTHNIAWIVGLIIIAGGALIGGGIGTTIAMCQAYAKNVTISKSIVAKGFLIGAATGASITAAMYGGIYVGIKFLPAILNKFAASLGLKVSTALMTKLASSAAAKTLFVGITLATTVPAEAKVGLNLIDTTVESFIEETEKREKAGINLSGLDDGGTADKSYKKVYGKPKLLHSKKISDPNGNKMNFVFVACNAS